MEPKILIVDDTRFDQKIISKCLSDAGFQELYFAYSGEEALEKLKNYLPHVAVVDTNMKGMDGFETCQEIKKHFPSVKIILITGNPQAVNFPKAREIQVDEYTVKTPNCSEIIWAVRKCVAKVKKDMESQEGSLD